jgi:peptidyl-tRNA hydrolase
MPELPNPLTNDEIAARARAEQADPLAMYLVVRRSQIGDVSAAGFIEAGAQATVRCVDEYLDEPAHAEAFREWYAGSFRKITLRADEKQWARLHEEFDLALGLDPFQLAINRDWPVMAALPPLRKSERPQLLKRMQAFKGDPFTLPAFEHPYKSAVTLVVNDQVEMSLGKTVAQAGHAALVLLKLAAGDWQHVWRENEMPFQVRSAAGRWDEILERYECAVIRDAGITEVAPRSATVLAIAPTAAA